MRRNRSVGRGLQSLQAVNADSWDPQVVVCHTDYVVRRHVGDGEPGRNLQMTQEDPVRVKHAPRALIRFPWSHETLDPDIPPGIRKEIGVRWIPLRASDERLVASPGEDDRTTEGVWTTSGRTCDTFRGDVRPDHNGRVTRWEHSPQLCGLPVEQVLLPGRQTGGLAAARNSREACELTRPSSSRTALAGSPKREGSAPSSSPISISRVKRQGEPESVQVGLVVVTTSTPALSATANEASGVSSALQAVAAMRINARSTRFTSASHLSLSAAWRRLLQGFTPTASISRSLCRITFLACRASRVRREAHHCQAAAER